MTSYRNISSVGVARKRPGSREFSAANVSSGAVGSDIDPVISIDHFNIRAPTFPPHPHAGFSAVTYLFEDSEGQFINRDGLGHRALVSPGAIIWTVTGRGVMHEEYPAVRGELSHGLQIFVNLPAAAKLQPPRLQVVDGPDVPIRELPGVRVRVAAGNSGDVRAKLESPNGVSLLDATLQPGATFEEVFPAEFSVLAYVIRGAALVGPGSRRLGPLEAASFEPGPGSILVKAASEGAQVVFLAGRPLREPGASYGPFFMNTQRQLEEAFERYRAGEMGRLVSEVMPDDR